MTAIDVFSRYLFAYPLVEATASNTAKVLIDIMTKHAYLPTTLITDKGTAFSSKIIDEITKILGITLKCATTKHPQTIGKLERTHASLKINLKMASGEYRHQWHKYLPLAVLNYNTTCDNPPHQSLRLKLMFHLVQIYSDKMVLQVPSVHACLML